jgi:hypothetical protein
MMRAETPASADMPTHRKPGVKRGSMSPITRTAYSVHAAALVPRQPAAIFIPPCGCLRFARAVWMTMAIRSVCRRFRSIAVVAYSCLPWYPEAADQPIQARESIRCPLAESRANHRFLSRIPTVEEVVAREPDLIIGSSRSKKFDGIAAADFCGKPNSSPEALGQQD